VSDEQMTVKDLIDYITKPKTIPSLSNYLKDVLSRTIANRGDPNITLFNAREGYTAGFHDGTEQTIKFVLQALEEIENGEQG